MREDNKQENKGETRRKPARKRVARLWLRSQEAQLMHRRERKGGASVGVCVAGGKGVRHRARDLEWRRRGDHGENLGGQSSPSHPQKMAATSTDLALVLRAWGGSDFMAHM